MRYSACCMMLASSPSLRLNTPSVMFSRRKRNLYHSSKLKSISQPMTKVNSAPGYSCMSLSRVSAE